MNCELGVGDSRAMIVEEGQVLRLKVGNIREYRTHDMVFIVLCLFGVRTGKMGSG